jgi:hypothetical protein
MDGEEINEGRSKLKKQLTGKMWMGAVCDGRVEWGKE